MQRIISVTSPAATTMLTTLSNVKSELGISGSGSDSLLTRYINGASSRICKFLNRTLARQTYSEKLRRTGRQVPFELLLSHAPIVSVSLIDEDGTTLVAGTDYEIKHEPGILTRISSQPTFWYGDETVISYVAGYLLPNDGSPTLPADIEDACIDLVVSRYRSKGRDPSIRSQSAEGIGSASYRDPSAESGGLPDHIAQMLTSHTRIVI